MSKGEATGSRLEDPNPVRRLADLGGLCALAVAHPVFEVLSESREFFVARNTTLTLGVGMVFVLVVVLPALLFCLELLAGLLRRGSGPRVHSLLVGLLTVALVLPWLKRGDVPPDVVGPTALLVGLLCGSLHHRTQVARLFVTALAPAILAVPYLFLANRDVTRTLVPAEDDFVAVEIEDAPPVVFVVFDEFPLNSLLDENHEIDSGRYPNFAALAADSRWFRNAATVSSETMWALPAIVSGSYPLAPGAVPTRRYYPDNLFTLLADRYDMTVFGRFLQLCPASRCDYDLGAPRETMTALLADIAVVWLHIVLPDALTQSLPPIVGDWRGFAQRRNFRSTARGTEPNDREAEFDRFLDLIEKDGEARLYFLHSLLPHMPFSYVPSGHRYEAPDHQGTEIGRKRLFEAAGATFADVLYQRHLLQVGFVDRLIGKLIRRLKETGIYDEALVIVTADHGAAFHPGLPRRRAVDEVLSDIVLVPLLVKLPGQRTGVAIDDNVAVVDILPTVADVLSVDLPFDVDGQSLLDPADPGRGRLLVHRNRTRVRVEQIGRFLIPSRESVASKIARLGSRTNARLYGVGRAAWRLGGKVPQSSLAAGPATDSTVRVTALETSRSPRGGIPLYVRGMLATTREQPVALAIAAGDEIVATTETYDDFGQWRFASALPGVALGKRADDLRIFVIDDDGGAAILAPIR